MFGTYLSALVVVCLLVLLWAWLQDNGPGRR